MYLPKGPEKKPENPLKVQNARSFFVSSGAIAVFASVAAAILALRKVQKRARHDVSTTDLRRTGKRVAIIGGGAAGSALAANLTTFSETVNVTVFEKQHRQTFYGLVPYANVGHRSYDLNTTGGVDFLSSPASWNVTREVKLVAKEIVKVNPQENRVVADDGSTYDYDYLVIATGANRKLGHLSRFFSGCPAEAETAPVWSWRHWFGHTESRPSIEYLIDRHGIAVNPGIVRDSLVHSYHGNIVHVKVPPESFVRAMEDKNVAEAIRQLGTGSVEAEQAQRQQHAFASRFMTYYGRQHDSTFVSSINLIWKYLKYFGKQRTCSCISVTADSEPSDAFPTSVNDAIRLFFTERKVDLRTNTYVHFVDPIARRIVLKNYITGELTELDFKMLVLDLPLVAPAFIAESGLDAKCSASKMTAWWHVMARSVMKGTPTPQTQPQPRTTEGYVDVDPETLQHRRYANIFAVGDCAALPTVKSYGAVFAQIPIASHNIRALIANDEHTPAQGTSTPLRRSPNAMYNGYSSFDIVMTTWRAMWPEMVYNENQQKILRSAREAKQARTDPSKTTSSAAQDVSFEEAACFSVQKPLDAVNHHLYDNLAWRDLRGFANGFYIQSTLYEVMYWFFFMRGAWHPPTWFHVPTYDVLTGNPIPPSMFGL